MISTLRSAASAMFTVLLAYVTASKSSFGPHRGVGDAGTRRPYRTGGIPIVCLKNGLPASAGRPASAENERLALHERANPATAEGDQFGQHVGFEGRLDVVEQDRDVESQLVELGRQMAGAEMTAHQRQ